ncbi:hypothetical protein [Leptothoe spongobia]|uniref:Uncharacterized protein n=1 Tax=Leptothoe spongobia TAU-MAC 1115 TaxID=1967444 RepID=A0A947GK92_9CYAN|nr:hypothetical protein [Leptothoe spongobia]MBT9316122.1 hypothetical protein [Leptothoe spongobia TAU-MAC 1115]
MTSSVFPKSLRHWLKVGLAPSIALSIFFSTSNPTKTAVLAQSSDTTTVAFDLNADLQDQSEFYNLPYPSDFRLDANDQPDLSGFPVFSEKFGLFKRLKTIASDRPGFPTTAAGYFRFDQPLAPLNIEQRIPAERDSPILLMDIDRNSPERGRLFPVVASTPAPDPFYVPKYLLAVSPFPGIVLKPNRKYAYVVRDNLKDANGQAIKTTEVFTQLKAGGIPQGQMKRKFLAYALYQPLWETLDLLEIDREGVVVATVFTTGDVVAEMASISDQVLDDYKPNIRSLKRDSTQIISDLDYCKFTAKIRLPQFQKGFPPYFFYKEKEGLFVVDANDKLRRQRSQTIPVVITLPKTPMPAEGYPLVAYYHGTGGLSTQVVDRGPVPKSRQPRLPDQEPVRRSRLPDRGPADVVGSQGFASVSSALPLNPERLNNVSAVIFSDLLDGRIYLNPVNLSAYRDTFRQGVIEQRLLLSALERLHIAPEALAGCEGPTLPTGETHFRLQTDAVMALGQSQGAQYALMMAAVEPKIRAVVPTGSGGFWSLLFSNLANPDSRKAPIPEFCVNKPPDQPEVVCQVNDLGDIDRLLGQVQKRTEPLNHLYPALRLLQSSWESVEPMVYAPRIAKRPLPDHPVRSIYQPVGQRDSDFPEEVFNAIALASNVQQAGPTLWPGMQESLALEKLDAPMLSYPISQNLISDTGIPYTGVVVQYESDLIENSHTIFSQRLDVKYQYGCFLKSFQQNNMGTVLSPRPVLPPCLFP